METDFKDINDWLVETGLDDLDKTFNEKEFPSTFLDDEELEELEENINEEEEE